MTRLPRGTFSPYGRLATGSRSDPRGWRRGRRLTRPFGFHDQCFADPHAIANDVVPLPDVLRRRVESRRDARYRVPAADYVGDRHVDEGGDGSPYPALANRFDALSVQSPVDECDQLREGLLVSG